MTPKLDLKIKMDIYCGRVWPTRADRSPPRRQCPTGISRRTQSSLRQFSRITHRTVRQVRGWWNEKFRSCVILRMMKMICNLLPWSATNPSFIIWPVGTCFVEGRIPSPPGDDCWPVILTGNKIDVSVDQSDLFRRSHAFCVVSALFGELYSNLII